MCEKKKNVNFNEASGSEKESNWKTNKGKKISCVLFHKLILTLDEILLFKELSLILQATVDTCTLLCFFSILRDFYKVDHKLS